MGGTVWVAITAAAATLLAGCAGPPADVALEVHAEPDGDGWVFVAEATNRGAEPILYRHGCQQAWEHVLHRNGEPVDMGTAPCHAFEPAELSSGATHTLRVDWDGAEWRDGGREEAPPAAYAWRVSFLDLEGRAVANETVVVDKGQSVRGR